MSRQEGANPEVKWEDGTWFVTLPVESGKVVEASWKPDKTWVVRIREGGAEHWSFGFETLATSFTFLDLKPGTEYEVQVRARTAAGEGPPTSLRIRTGPAGDSGIVIPFPKRRRTRDLRISAAPQAAASLAFAGLYRVG